MSAQRTRYKSILAAATSATSDQTSDTFEMKHYRHAGIMLVYSNLTGASGTFVIEGSLDNSCWDVMSNHWTMADEAADGYTTTDGYFSPGSTAGAQTQCELIQMDNVCVPYLRVRWESNLVSAGTVEVQISAVT